jgi:hypothetical protein
MILIQSVLLLCSIVAIQILNQDVSIWLALLTNGLSIALMLVHFRLPINKPLDTTQPSKLKSVWFYLGVVIFLALLSYIEIELMFVLLLGVTLLTILLLKWSALFFVIPLYFFYKVDLPGESFTYGFYTSYWTFMAYYLFLSFESLVSARDLFSLFGINNYNKWLNEDFYKDQKGNLDRLVSVMKTVEKSTPSEDLVTRKYSIKLDLDEQFDYANKLEKSMVRIYNQRVLSNFKDLETVKTYDDLLISVNQLEQDRELVYNNKIKHASFMELLRGHGYQNEIYAEKEQTILKPYYQFMYSILSAESDTSLYRDIARIKLGVLGEDDLIKELDLYNDLFDYGHSVRVEYLGSSVESDVIVYSRKGIFTLEAKNYGKSGSYNLHIAKDGQWKKILKSGREEVTDSVVAQATRHVVIKQKLLNEELRKKGLANPDRYYTLESIIVIVNDVVQITNETDYPILRISQLYNYIQKLPDIYTKEEVDAIRQVFEENSLDAKKYAMEDFLKEFEDWLDLVVPVYELGYTLKPLLSEALLN